MRRPFLVLKKDCSEAIYQLSGWLGKAGLQVVQTFDLHTSPFDQHACTCPYHGTEQCDCARQNCTIAVLLVYQPGSPPASIIAHGHAGQTWFMWADSLPQDTRAGLEAAVQDLLAAHILSLDPGDENPNPGPKPDRVYRI